MTFSIALAMVALVLIFAYFIPTVIACARDHHNAGPIFLVNLLMGWTMFGWLAAFVWSLTATRRPLRTIYR